MDDRITAACGCGARFSVASRFLGKFVTCPACGLETRATAAAPLKRDGRIEAVAKPPPRVEPVPAAAPPAPSRPPPPPGLPRDPAWQRHTPWVLVLSLLPLFLYMTGPADDSRERLKRSLEENPELKARNVDDFLRLLPAQRLKGASHPRDTGFHWMYAALSSNLFWFLILVLFPMGSSTSRQLWATGLFTGTVGILLLLAVQLTFMGFFYSAAVDPKTSFWTNLLGYTFGVGLCEEVVKALPILWHFRRRGTLDVRGAAVWGLATGIGFGVSEGVFYSTVFYNGISGGLIYLVRFVSCVGLHAVWSATVAILIHRFRDEIEDLEHAWQWPLLMIRVIPASMILHGLYDTFLSRELSLTAFVSALSSFVLFFTLYRTMRRREELEAAKPPESVFVL